MSVYCSKIYINVGSKDRMELPRIRNYMDYSSSNYGSSREVSIGSLDLYFSYETVIAVRTPFSGLIIRENDWSTTTGKHLNAINSDHSMRVSSQDFEMQLEEIMKHYRIVEGEPTL